MRQPRGRSPECVRRDGRSDDERLFDLSALERYGHGHRRPRPRRTAGALPTWPGPTRCSPAPPAPGFVDVTFNVGAIRLNHDWSVGIVAFNSDWDSGDYPYGCYPWNSYCGVGTAVFSIQAVASFSHANFRFQTRCVNTSGWPVRSPFQSRQPADCFGRRRDVRVRDVPPPRSARLAVPGVGARAMNRPWPSMMEASQFLGMSWALRKRRRKSRCLMTIREGCERAGAVLDDGNLEYWQANPA